jgi:hypothetical protein
MRHTPVGSQVGRGERHTEGEAAGSNIWDKTIALASRKIRITPLFFLGISYDSFSISLVCKQLLLTFCWWLQFMLSNEPMAAYPDQAIPQANWQKTLEWARGWLGPGHLLQAPVGGGENTHDEEDKMKDTSSTASLLATSSLNPISQIPGTSFEAPFSVVRDYSGG